MSPRPNDPNDAEKKREKKQHDDTDRPTRGSQKEKNDDGYPDADPPEDNRDD